MAQTNMHNEDLAETLLMQKTINCKEGMKNIKYLPGAQEHKICRMRRTIYP
jgi:hypothetical protein